MVACLKRSLESSTKPRGGNDMKAKNTNERIMMTLRSRVLPSALFILIFGISTIIAYGQMVYPLTALSGWIDYDTVNVTYSSSTGDLVPLFVGYSNPDRYRSFLTFDTSGIPDGAIINSIAFHFYVNTNSSGIYAQVWDMSDPISSNNATKYSDAGSGTQYSSSFGLTLSGWREEPLLAAARTDLRNTLSTDRWNCGIAATASTEGYARVRIEGAGSANRPYLVVSYTTGTTSITTTVPTTSITTTVPTTSVSTTVPTTTVSTTVSTTIPTTTAVTTSIPNSVNGYVRSYITRIESNDAANPIGSSNYPIENQRMELDNGASDLTDITGYYSFGSPIGTYIYSILKSPNVLEIRDLNNQNIDDAAGNVSIPTNWTIPTNSRQIFNTQENFTWSSSLAGYYFGPANIFLHIMELRNIFENYGFVYPIFIDVPNFPVYANLNADFAGNKAYFGYSPWPGLLENSDMVIANDYNDNPDVIDHEYTHATIYYAYRKTNIESGLENEFVTYPYSLDTVSNEQGAMDEGLSDFYSGIKNAVTTNVVSRSLLSAYRYDRWKYTFYDRYGSGTALDASNDYGSRHDNSQAYSGALYQYYLAHNHIAAGFYPDYNIFVHVYEDEPRTFHQSLTDLIAADPDHERQARLAFGLHGIYTDEDNPASITGSKGIADDGDDAQPSARVISTGSYANLRCYDDDYYKISIAAPAVLTITTVFLHNSGDLDLDMRNGNNNVIASSSISSESNGSEQISYSISISGDYYVRVFGKTAHRNPWLPDTNWYDLNIAVTPTTTTVTTTVPTTSIPTTVPTTSITTTVPTTSVTTTIPTTVPTTIPTTIVTTTSSSTTTSISEAPEIQVFFNEAEISTGGQANYGDRVLNSPCVGTFRIHNAASSAALSLLNDPVIAITGLDAAEFSVVQQPGTQTVVGSDSTQFVIRFIPVSLGPKKASISIYNNDPDENPFVINLRGYGNLIWTQEIYSNYGGDILDSQPATGGENQPVGLVIPASGQILVKAASNGITTKPAEINDGMSSEFFSIDYAFSAVTQGLIRIEALVSLNQNVASTLLQTTESVTGLLITRLSSNYPGEIVGPNAVAVGSYQPNVPFRVRMYIDMNQKNWSASIDNELDGFADDPLVELQFMNDPDNIGGLHCSAHVAYEQAATTIAYDDIYVGVSDGAPLRKDDLVGTWDGQGVYYRNSDTGAWVPMASPATMITTGDIDNDGTDDLIGIWPSQGGVWVKYYATGEWVNLSSTAVYITIGDMNGDGRVDLLGTWDGQGVYYRDSATGGWVQMSSPASMITCGDLDNDGTDDLIGIWAGQGGVWVKYSSTGGWEFIGSTPSYIGAGDMNGDGRDELLGSWAGQGVYFRNSETGAWVQMSSEATMITAGDLEGDGIDDLIGLWPTQGGIWVKYSSTGGWELLSSTAQYIAAGKMRPASGSSEIAGVMALPMPMGGMETGPGGALRKTDESSKGPGGSRFVYMTEPNLVPREKGTARLTRVPGPRERMFDPQVQANLVPGETGNKRGNTVPKGGSQRKTKKK